MKQAFLSLVIVALLATCKPKEPEVLTQQNLREVLTQYGKENPENRVVIVTRFGTIKLRLYEETPLHRANFVRLIKEGHYAKADFYRIVYEFMIQGGDPSKKLSYRIPAEFNTKYIHKKGALSMARVDENNPEHESSAAEFFIVHGTGYYEEDLDKEAATLGLNLTDEQKKIYTTVGGYVTLDQRYTVFGEVTEGLDVVEKIAREPVFDIDRPLRKIPLEISVSKE